MKLITTAAAGVATVFVGIVSATLAAGPAAAAPAGHPNADELVMQLQDLGNVVIVNRTGTLPLAECTVTAVRPGQTYTRFDSGYPGAQNDPLEQVQSMTVFVDARC